MNRIHDDVAAVLSDPEVHRYFLGVLSGDQSPAGKYDQFIKFFQLRDQIREKIDCQPVTIRNGNEAQRLISETCRILGIWSPETIVSETEDAIIRAVRRLNCSQHRDGGWGFKPEISDFWATAYALLCLNAAGNRTRLEFHVDRERMMEKGMLWVKKNPETWSAKTIHPDSGIPVYHVALAIFCFSQLADSDSVRLDGEIQSILQAQNRDGGWDAHIWGEELQASRRVYSEAGATSFAVQALNQYDQGSFAPHIKRALNWLIHTQNTEFENGSWNDGSCQPHGEEFKLSGSPSINKTCDAIQGLMIGNLLFPTAKEEARERIDSAVEWLRNQEKPLFEDRGIMGWGWDFSPFKFDNTCLTLETLVRMPEAPLPLLTSNARWLIRNQYKETGNVEDGNWRSGHTARIALSLIHFYQTIQKSVLFKERS